MADKRPVARSGKNEGQVDYSTAQSPQSGQGMLNKLNTMQTPPGRKCPYLDRVATLSEVFTPEECKKNYQYWIE